VRAGLRYAFANPEIRSILISVAVVGVFAFNFNVTIPLLVRQTFGGSAATFGLFSAMTGAGAVVGGLVVAHRSRPSARLLTLVCGLFAVTIFAVALAPTESIALVVMLPLGATSIAFIATANATLQMLTAEQMRGRVMALYSIGFLGSTPIGAPLIGVVTALSTPRVAFAVGGGATVVATALLAVGARQTGRDVPVPT